MKTDVTTYKRNLRPSHKLVRVESYSRGSKLTKYDTSVFEVSGYKWRLSLYPNGDSKEDNNGARNHISVYLSIVETDSLPACWEVHAIFKVFFYDHIKDNYLTIQGIDESESTRFHESKRTRGFAKALPLETFKEPSNGYLVDDSFTFGAEVFVLSPTLTSSFESLTFAEGREMSDSPLFTWKIENFSSLKEKFHRSDVFRAGNVCWELWIYPKGERLVKGESSLFLVRAKCGYSTADQAGFYAEFKLRLLDQVNGRHYETSECYYYCDAEDKSPGAGQPRFMSLEELHKPSNGFIVDDTVVVEAEFLVVSETC